MRKAEQEDSPGEPQTLRKQAGANTAETGEARDGLCAEAQIKQMFGAVWAE